MLLPRKIIILAIIIHIATIIACASLQPEEVDNVNEQRMEQMEESSEEVINKEEEAEMK